MRGLVLLLVVALGCTLPDLDQNSAFERSQRSELEALRRNAGLSRSQYLEEMRRMDPEWYRKDRKAYIELELERRGLYNPGPGRKPPPMHDRRVPADLRAIYEALPEGETHWSVDQLLYRARRLGAGVTEAEVVRELQEQDPRWKPE